MSDEIPIAFAVLLAAVASVEAWRRYTASNARLLRTFHRMATTDPREARDGTHVKIAGSAEPAGDSALHAPFSGEPCLAYAISVTRLGLGDASEPTVQMLDDSRAAPFIVHGRDCAVRVEAGDAAPLLVAAENATQTSFKKLPERVREMLAERGFDREEVGGAHATIVVREWLVSRGDRVEVAGVLHLEAAAIGDAMALPAMHFRDAPRSYGLRPAKGSRLVIVTALT